MCLRFRNRKKTRLVPLSADCQCRNGICMRKQCRCVHKILDGDRSSEAEEKKLKRLAVLGICVFGQCVRATEEEVSEEKFIKYDTLISGQIQHIPNTQKEKEKKNKSANKRASHSLFSYELCRQRVINIKCKRFRIKLFRFYLSFGVESQCVVQIHLIFIVYAVCAGAGAASAAAAVVAAVNGERAENLLFQSNPNSYT